MEWLIGGGLIVSGLTSLWGAISGANAQEEAAQKNQQLANLQANELLARQTINENIMREQAAYASAHTATAMAATGRAGGGLGQAIAINRALTENINLSRRDAEFKAQAIRMGAQYDLEAVNASANAQRIGAFGNFLGNVANAGLTYHKFAKGNAEKLDQPSSSGYSEYAGQYIDYNTGYSGNWTKGKA